MIAVLAIIGIIGSVAVPIFVDLSATSSTTALYNGVSKLNNQRINAMDQIKDLRLWMAVRFYFILANGY
jgi:type II secretory pathway pseudopilin PulG